MKYDMYFRRKTENSWNNEEIINAHSELSMVVISFSDFFEHKRSKKLGYRDNSLTFSEQTAPIKLIFEKEFLF